MDLLLARSSASKDAELLVLRSVVVWRNVHQVMGEVLSKEGSTASIWDERPSIFAAIEAGEGVRAERLARQHSEHGRTLILDGLGVTEETDRERYAARG